MIELPPFDPDIEDPLWSFARLPSIGTQAYLTRDILMSSARYLCQFSERHKTYTDGDISRIVYPAIVNDQSLFIFAPNPDTGFNQPRGFVTWLYMRPSVEDGYLNGTRKLQPEDFEYRGLDSNIWMLDMVCPFSRYDVVFLCRQAQKWLSPICRERGLPGVLARRTDKTVHEFMAISKSRLNKRS